MNIRYLLIPVIFILNTVANSLIAEGIEEKIKKIAAEANGRVGVGLYIIESNKSAWLNQSDHFPMQSVYKMPIGMTVLALIDSGKIKLDEMVLVKKSELIGTKQHSPIRDAHPEGDFKISVSELLRYAVSESDGSASDVLMRLAGGPEKVMSYLNKIGIKDICVKNTELEIGKNDSVQYQNWATPKDAIQLLKVFYEGKALKSESRQLMIKLMTDTQTGQNRLKGLLPKGTAVAHKTGSSGTVNGNTAATNDIGIIDLPNGQHLLAAVFVADSKADDTAREKVIARIARLGWDTFGNEK